MNNDDVAMTQPKLPNIGKPLDLTPEQLDEAAEVTPLDVVMARALWLNAAPPKLADLLDATPTMTQPDWF